MKLVHEKLECVLDLECGVNTMRICSPSLYSRCALAASQYYPSDSLEPAAFIDDTGKQLKAKDVMHFVGDPLLIDLNDRFFSSLLIRRVVEELAIDPEALLAIETLNATAMDLIEDQLVRCSADYRFDDVWSFEKYLKATGIGVDDTADVSVFDKVCHLVRLAADLIPSKTIVITGVRQYLEGDQFEVLCELARAEQIKVLSYERGDNSQFNDLENGIYIDDDYIEHYKPMLGSHSDDRLLAAENLPI